MLAISHPLDHWHWFDVIAKSRSIEELRGAEGRAIESEPSESTFRPASALVQGPTPLLQKHDSQTGQRMSGLKQYSELGVFLASLMSVPAYETQLARAGDLGQMRYHG
jgi:hypothetical protein